MFSFKKTAAYIFSSLFLLHASIAHATTYYEGTYTFTSFGRIDAHWLTQFLPYNPVIVDVGAYCGANTILLARHWPKSKVFALEPNPRAFAVLQKAVTSQHNVKIFNLALNSFNGTAPLYLTYGPQGNDMSYEPLSSLLPPSPEMQSTYAGYEIDVPCITLDDFCKQNQIDKIDILKLELEGAELQVLRNSPEILKNVKVLWLQTFFKPYRENMAFYFDLKDYLLKANFVVLAHWYEQGERGNAIYISQELFDAYFVKSLGLGSGGIAYP